MILDVQRLALRALSFWLKCEVGFRMTIGWERLFFLYLSQVARLGFVHINWHSTVPCKLRTGINRRNPTVLLKCWSAIQSA